MPQISNKIRRFESARTAQQAFLKPLGNDTRGFGEQRGSGFRVDGDQHGTRRLNIETLHSDADHRLAEQMRLVDAIAFDVMIEKYKQPIINYAARFLGDATEAHDVAQNVFVQVFKQADRFQFESKVSTWLFAIARNLCRNEYRRRLRHRTEVFDGFSVQHRSMEQPNSEDLRQANVPQAVFETELQQKIEESLTCLPKKQRTAIVLLHEQGSSYDEIAALLGTSVSAIKGLIYRARQKLKRQLCPYLRTGAWAAKPQSTEVPRALVTRGSSVQSTRAPRERAQAFRG